MGRSNARTRYSVWRGAVRGDGVERVYLDRRRGFLAEIVAVFETWGFAKRVARLLNEDERKKSGRRK